MIQQYCGVKQLKVDETMGISHSFLYDHVKCAMTTVHTHT